LARKATVVSRFPKPTRPAGHHNVVQIYDLGQEGETNFFSMEFVQGQNLAELVKQNMRLEPRKPPDILQAAADFNSPITRAWFIGTSNPPI
jgi:serine/threonine-protein kinase